MHAALDINTQPAPVPFVTTNEVVDSIYSL